MAPRGQWCLSTAMSEIEVNQAIAAFRGALPTVAAGRVAGMLVNTAAGVLVGDLSFADFSNGPNSIIGNLGGIDVLCQGQFPVTLNAKTLIGGATNCAN